MERYIEVGDHWKQVAATLKAKRATLRGSGHNVPLVMDKQYETARRMARNSYAFVLNQAWYNRAPVKGGIPRRVALCRDVWSLSDSVKKSSLFEPAEEDSSLLSLLSGLARQNRDDAPVVARARHMSRARQVLTQTLHHAYRVLHG